MHTLERQRILIYIFYTLLFYRKQKLELSRPRRNQMNRLCPLRAVVNILGLAISSVYLLLVCTYIFISCSDSVHTAYYVLKRRKKVDSAVYQLVKLKPKGNETSVPSNSHAWKRERAKTVSRLISIVYETHFSFNDSAGYKL